MLKWQVASKTHEGKQRKKNEDNHFVSSDNRIFLVADGMGGTVGGAVAAQLTSQTIANLWQNNNPDISNHEAIEQWLQESIRLANLSIYNEAKNNPGTFGMGTTIVVAVQGDDNQIDIAHVGDSRAYLVRDGKSSLLTCDHSVVQEMVLAGKLTKEQARINPYKNLITRCLGHEDKIKIDFTQVNLKTDDWIVLCSDGLPAVLQDDEISNFVSKVENPELACDKLVDETLNGGAPDNVTVIAIHYFEDDNHTKEMN